MEKTKRTEITQNKTKVKTLLFLEMRKRAVYEMTTARQIAIAINGSARSLYVLLERWFRWDLVIRYATSPFSYCIDAEGERYLSKIDNWFFSGYYSRKRKQRVLGYRGTVEALKLEIAIAAKAVFMAYDRKRNELFSLEAPFTKAACFVREPMAGQTHKRWGADRLLVTEFEKIHLAYNTAIKLFGEKTVKPAGQAMVDAGIGVSWSEEEK